MVALRKCVRHRGMNSGADVLTISDLDQEVRRGRSNTLHEFNVAGRDLRRGEAAGRRRHPIGAVEDFELTAGNVAHRIGKIGEAGVADIEIAVRQHRGAAFAYGQRDAVEDRTDIDGCGDGGAVHDIVVGRPRHRAVAVGSPRGELDRLQRGVEVGG